MNKIIGAVCYVKDTRFHNGSGQIFKLVMFINVYHVPDVPQQNFPKEKLGFTLLPFLQPSQT
jgi:hypothetical protein